MTTQNINGSRNVAERVAWLEGAFHVLNGLQRASHLQTLAERVAWLEGTFDSKASRENDSRLGSVEERVAWLEGALDMKLNLGLLKSTAKGA